MHSTVLPPDFTFRIFDKRFQRLQKRFVCTIVVGTLLVLLQSFHVSAAPPTMDFLYPAGGQQGTTVSVKLSGQTNAKTQVWCSRSEIKVSLKSHQLTCIIPKNSVPGVAWIRLYNEEGASTLKPFLIGTLPEVSEKEPNNSLEQAMKLNSANVLVNGQLSKSEEVDTFRVSLKKGQTLVAAMAANSVLGSPMDGVLQIVSERGFVLEQNDDDQGTDPRIVFTAPKSGTFFIRAFAFPSTPNSSIRLAGAPGYIYRLTLTTGPFLDYPYPLAAERNAKTPISLRGWNLPAGFNHIHQKSDSRSGSIILWSPKLATARTVQQVEAPCFTEEDWRSRFSKQPGSVPVFVTGQLAQPKESDRFRFRGKPGMRLQIAATSRSLGFPTDPVLRTLDKNGTEFKQVESRSSTKIDESLTFIIPKSGEFQVEVSDLHRRGGSRFVYLLSLRELKPDFQLSLSGDSFQLIPGKPLTIPVTVTRLNGFRATIEISAQGLPPGVTAKPVKSLAKGATAKTVKLTLSISGKKKFPAGIPFQVVGRSLENRQARRRFATSPISGFTAKTADFWLTVRSKSPMSNRQKKPKTQ
ncbi:MAG: PPC domain-containing protein [Planctomycetaceae bacterium]